MYNISDRLLSINRITNAMENKQTKTTLSKHSQNSIEKP